MPLVAGIEYVGNDQVPPELASTDAIERQNVEILDPMRREGFHAGIKTSRLPASKTAVSLHKSGSAGRRWPDSDFCGSPMGPWYAGVYH